MTVKENFTYFAIHILYILILSTPTFPRIALSSPESRPGLVVSIWVIQVTDSLTATCIVVALHSGLLRLLWMEELIFLSFISPSDYLSLTLKMMFIVF